MGDFGDSLYVVRDSRVEVEDGGRIIDTLGEREVFGEMALLDAEPRVASVRAVETTRLLRLDRAPFIEMCDAPAGGASPLSAAQDAKMAWFGP